MLGYVGRWIPPKRPTAPEAPNFEMQIETKTGFAWCSDGRIIAVGIGLEFPGIVPEIGPSPFVYHQWAQC